MLQQEEEEKMRMAQLGSLCFGKKRDGKMKPDEPDKQTEKPKSEEDMKKK